MSWADVVDAEQSWAVVVDAEQSWAGVVDAEQSWAVVVDAVSLSRLYSLKQKSQIKLFCYIHSLVCDTIYMHNTGL